jgi:hypothetical protein
MGVSVVIKNLFKKGKYSTEGISKKNGKRNEKKFL